MAGIPQKRIVTIGRHASNDVVLSDGRVSSKHARVVFGPDGVFLEDLGSSNGTFLDGQAGRIARLKLEPQQVICFGRTRLPAIALLKMGDGSVAAPEEEAATQLGSGPNVAHGAISLDGRSGTLIMGRSASCDLRLDYPMVSSRHARLIIRDGTLTIADLGSANGTFVNGRRIQRSTQIQPGDQIGLATVWFVLSPDGRALLSRDVAGDVTIEARGVGVTVQRSKQLLSSVDLCVMPGELVGLMGPSGAGKSTLISALNGYVPPTEGAVTINGRDLYRNFGEFQGMVGYVPQDDIMHADLTVEEALYFSARLRLPVDFTDQEIGERIKKVLDELGLAGCSRTRIGNAERRGVSGGQRKRVNVAMELLTNPPLLFLDEPTSGLSSEDALSLMQLLRRLADGGKTIILTIHQPSLDVFRLMDNLIVVGKDTRANAAGRLVYFGPAYPDAVTFFDDTADTTSPPQSADGVLRGLSRRPVDEWVQRYRASPYHRMYVENRLQRQEPKRTKPARRRRTSHGLSQYWTLLRRGLAVKIKDRWNTAILLVQAPLIALLIGLVFGPKVSEEVDVAGFADSARATATTMFLLGVSALWFGCSNAAREIVAESAIYRRERMVGLGIPSYLGAKVTLLGALSAFQCLVLLMLAGGLCWIQASWFGLLFSLFMASLVGSAIGLVVSAAARTAEVAAAVLPLVILPMVILGGVLLPLPELPRSPVPMKAIAQLMPSRWAFEALMLPEAESRDALDLDVQPPELAPPGDEERSRVDPPMDMAEVFFPVGDGRLGQGFAIGLLASQAVVFLITAGVILKTRDVA
jgi:ABC-type multidrug transport system ATPase subunit/pSer/pThr/pTyr-binding forkhead associated (FHA) protein